MWIIWKCRNALIFYQKLVQVRCNINKEISFFNDMRSVRKFYKQWVGKYIEVDKSFPIVFFDGESKNKKCGCGVFIVL